MIKAEGFCANLMSKAGRAFKTARCMGSGPERDNAVRSAARNLADAGAAMRIICERLGLEGEGIDKPTKRGALLGTMIPRAGDLDEDAAQNERTEQRGRGS